jgi:Ice-binding-like
VTNTGPTVINGNLGVSPGSAATGFPPGIVVPPGTIHTADAVGAGAQSDNTIAYNALAGQVCNLNLTGQDLGGLTLVPGVYCFSSSAQLTGALTLNAQGNPNAVFIFQIGSTLTTASNSSVNIINGGSPCNVFWQVGSSAALGTTTSFMGNILALTSITLNTSTRLSGRALAQNGAVTLDSNTVSITECNASFIAPPTIVKTFGAAAIGVGGTATLNFTIGNANLIPLTGVAFNDTLPVGLIVSTPNNGLMGSCGSGSITAVAGSGSVSLTGATLAPGASCTFSVNVTGTATGTESNSVTVSSANGGTGNTSTTSLIVLATPPATAAPTITKAFGAATIGVGGSTTLSFTINANAMPQAGVAFTDTLPAGLVVSTPNGLTGSCGGGTVSAVSGSGSISLTGATLTAGASCTFAVNVTAITAGVQNNSVSVSSTNGGTGNTSTASVTTVGVAPTISKSFGKAVSIPLGGTTALSFTISNPNSTVALTGIGFIDNLPAGLVVATPNGLTGSCGGGTIAAAPGSGSISLMGATLASSASCTFSVNVTALVEGVLTNTTGNVTSSNGTLGATASATITVGAFEVSYEAHLNIGDSFVNLTNAGTQGGNICVNVYVFTPDENLISCCSCLVTPNGLNSLSSNSDLVSNPLTLLQPTSIVKKLVASTPIGGRCDASSPTAANLAAGMRAWDTKLHALPTTPVTYGVTETEFSPVTLSAAELARVTALCGFLEANGSGFGICRSCRPGALGSVSQ